LAKVRVFSPYDGKLGVFLQPFTFLHSGQALRAWEEIVNDPTSMFSKHPADFVLYEVGSFEEDKGLLEPLVPPHQLATALEVRRKPEAKLPLQGI